MRTLSNITLKEFCAVLTLLGLDYERSKGGHEAWWKEGMTRPVIIQSHKDPVPIHVVQNAIRNLGLSRKEFLATLEKV